MDRTDLFIRLVLSLKKYIKQKEKRKERNVEGSLYRNEAHHVFFCRPWTPKIGQENLICISHLVFYLSKTHMSNNLWNVAYFNIDSEYRTRTLFLVVYPLTSIRSRLPIQSTNICIIDQILQCCHS